MKRICNGCGYCTDNAEDEELHHLGKHLSWVISPEVKPLFKDCTASCLNCEYEERAAEFWEAESMLQCQDCQQDRDNCPDCDNGSKYLSPDAYEYREDR